MSDQKVAMRNCANELQDHYQDAKKSLYKASKCAATGHQFELDGEQSASLLALQAKLKGAEAYLLELHVELAADFAAIDAELAGEATRRR